MSDTSKVTRTYKREDGTYFEARQRISEDPLEECPRTEQECEQVFLQGPQTIAFVADGFYNTDYDSNNPAA